MKHTLIFAIILICGISASKSGELGFIPVKDGDTRKGIEEDWILGKTWKLTTYYPSDATRKRIEEVIKAQKIDRSTIKDMFYYTRPSGEHLMFLACIEKDGKPRSHCVGFDKKGGIAVYWVQTYPEGKKPEYTAIAVPKAEQDGADQPTPAPESKPDGKEKPESESEGGSQ